MSLPRGLDPGPRRAFAHGRRYQPRLELLEDRLPPGAMLDVLLFPAFAALLFPEVTAGMPEVEPTRTVGGAKAAVLAENGQRSAFSIQHSAPSTQYSVLSTQYSVPSTSGASAAGLADSFAIPLPTSLDQLAAVTNSRPAAAALHGSGISQQRQITGDGVLSVRPAGVRPGNLDLPIPLAAQRDAALVAAASQFQPGMHSLGGGRSGPGPYEELLPAGFYWRYLDNGTDQGTAWSEIGFDDSAWVWGTAQLGYGDGDETTVVSYGPDPDNKYITTYFRTWFHVEDAARFQTLHTWLLRDDGAIAYLNGTEIYRSNMPERKVDYRTLASTSIGGDDENAWHHSALPTDLLVTGWNSLAVEIHQATPDSSDISFDFDLVGATVVRFAVFGDYGVAGPAEQAVADMVKSWYPDFVVTTGDNNYPTGSAATINANIGQYYCPFIRNPDAPANQRCASGLGANRFYPTAGNHDWDSTPGLVPYRNYFTLPGNERYYATRWGPVHLLAVDSDPREPDGITSGATQAQWLRVQLTASTATWNVVAMHHPPYSSAQHGNTPNLQWPYQQWGADVVLSGHDHTYERIVRSDFPYFVNGLGGNPSRYNFGTPVQGSMARYRDDWGAMYVEASPYYLYFAFWNVGYTYYDEHLLLA